MCRGETKLNDLPSGKSLLSDALTQSPPSPSPIKGLFNRNNVSTPALSMQTACWDGDFTRKNFHCAPETGETIRFPNRACKPKVNETDFSNFRTILLTEIGIIVPPPELLHSERREE